MAFWFIFLATFLVIFSFTVLVYAVLTLDLAFEIKLTLFYYWFDQLEEVLQWLSKLCPDCPEAYS